MCKHQGLFLFSTNTIWLMLSACLILGCKTAVTEEGDIKTLIDSSWRLEAPERKARLLEAITLAEEERNLDLSAQAHLTLGVFYEQYRDYHLADSAYQVALKKSRLANALSTEVSTLINLGQLYTYQRKLTLADSILTLTLERATALQDARLLGFTHFAFGLKYDRSSDIRNSVVSYGSALAYFKQLGETHLSNQITCLNYLGIQYAALGLFDQSSDAYLQAARLSLDTNDSSEYVSAIYQSGINLIKNGEYRQALRLGFQALNLIEPQQDPSKRARILNNLGDAYSGLYKQTMNRAYYDSASHFVTQSLVLKNELKDFKGSAYSLHNLGRLHLISGSGEALDYLDRAYQIWADEKDYANVAQASLSLGEFHLSRNLNRAKYYFKRADTLGKHLGNINARVEALKGLASVAREQGQFIAFTRHTDLRDSIVQSAQVLQKQQSVAATEVRLQTMEVTKENELLVLENEITGRVVKLRTRLVIVISVLLVFSLAILMVFFRNQQRLRLLNDRIKRITENALHSQSNGLSLLTSLVRSERSTNENSNEQRVLNDVLTKIGALSGLTHQLFQASMMEKESLKKRIDVCDYLTDLARETADSLLTENVDLEIDIETVQVTAKVALNLGLVLNEMITNSAKYAVSQGAQELEVQLLKTDEGIKMIYADDGLGFPPGFKFGEKESFGTRMIHKLIVDDLKGELEYDSSDEGLVYVVTISQF